MRYTASTRNAALLLGSIHAAAKQHNVEPELAKRVLNNTANHLEALEADPHTVFDNIDAQMAGLFLQWANALSLGDHHKANASSEALDKLAEQHPFTYAETKAIFRQYGHYATTAQAKKQYRQPKKNDPSFGQITKPLTADATVAIIGDWGTGTEDAQVLFKALMEHKPNVVLHLGDVYQAGMPLEIEEFFLEPMNAVCKDLSVPRPPVFTIPGNHEYFSGAVGYFELIDVLNQGIDPKWAQEASFFCLRSADDKWQFLGADTGLGCIADTSTPALQPDEVTWHQDRIREFPGKTIFMTHHQFVSADQHIYHNRPKGSHWDYRYFNPNLVDAFDVPIQNCPNGDSYLDRITLWMWGHDHYFIPYAPGLVIPKNNDKPSGGPGQPTLPLGQLLGGSARETQGSNRAVKSSLATWAQTDAGGNPIKPASTNDGIVNHTYAILELATGQISYYQVPAWYDSDQNPNKTPIATPLLVNSL